MPDRPTLRKYSAIAAALSLFALISISCSGSDATPTASPTLQPRGDLPGEPLSQERYETLDPILQLSYPRLITHPGGDQEIWWDRDTALSLEIPGAVPFCLPKNMDPEQFPVIAQRDPCRGMPDAIVLGPPSQSGRSH